MQKGQDNDAYKHAIVEKYFDTVYRLALSQTQDKNKADDVLQDVFVRYIKSDKTFESEEHLKAWLIRVTINCSKSTFTCSSVGVIPAISPILKLHPDLSCL